MALLVDDVRLLHEASETLYDTAYNISTRGYLLKAETGVEQPGANEYAATPYGVIRRLFRHVPPSCFPGPFIDYGFGLGRVAIIAARFPFRKVIGVEMSSKLCRQAQDNLKTSSVPRRADVQFVEADAAHFTVPDDTSVVYFYKFWPENNGQDSETSRAVPSYETARVVSLSRVTSCRRLVCRRHTIYPTIEWAVMRVQRP